MIAAYAPSSLRAGEADALAAAAAAGDPDRYLLRAGHALAVVVLRHLSSRRPAGSGARPGDGDSAARYTRLPSAVPARPEVRALAGAGVVGRRVVALVGPGNNGGDGLVALATLARRGADVTAVTVAQRHHEPAAALLRSAGGRVCALGSAAASRALERAEVVLDAVLGTGARGPVAGLPEIPRRAWRVACDLPSGLDAASGTAEPGVPWADTTVSLGAPTAGVLLGQGRVLAGDLVCVQLPGLLDPTALGEPALRVLTPREALGSVLRPGPTDHKYSRGVVGLLAGSPAYPGAAVLAGRAALATGIGMLTAFSRGAARDLLLADLPEAVVGERAGLPDASAAGKVSAWVISPGLGDEPEDLEAARAVLALASRAGASGAGASGAGASGAGVPVVLDASGLALLEPDVAPPALITPHAGELAALNSRLGLELPSAQEDPLGAARAAAAALGCVVLLKGSTTLVATPDGEVLAACSAGPELAVAGSGDTLAGIAGALLATHSARARRGGGADVARLAAAAAVLHGLAGAEAAAASQPGAEGLAPALARVLVRESRR